MQIFQSLTVWAPGAERRSDTTHYSIQSPIRQPGPTRRQKPPVFEAVCHACATHPVTHENVMLSSHLLCTALSGLLPARSPVPRAHALGFAAPPLRGFAAVILGIFTAVRRLALKGRDSTAQGVSPGFGGRISQALKGRRRSDRTIGTPRRCFRSGDHGDPTLARSWPAVCYR